MELELGDALAVVRGGFLGLGVGGFLVEFGEESVEILFLFFFFC